MKAPLVIVGSGLGGYGLAREVRRRDTERPIVVVTRDGGEQYAKPNLSAWASGGHGSAALVQADAATVAARLGLEVRTHATVEAVAPHAQTVTIDGQHLAFSDLVLAVGADPLRPPWLSEALLDSGRVFQVNDLDGYRRFRVALDRHRGQRILVVGAGLIGCEFATDLALAGFGVEVVDLAPHPLGRLLPAVLGEELAVRLAPHGIRWRTAQRITAMTTGPAGVAAQLGDGAAVHAALCLVAVGLQPRTALARAAGLTVGRGIAVDAWLRTSAQRVWALGDCAEVAGQWRPFVAPLMQGARALAATLSGTPTAVQPTPQPVVVKTPPWPTVLLPPEGEVQWQIERGADGARGLAVDGQGRLRGWVLMGTAAAERSHWLAAIATRPEAPAALLPAA